MTIYQAVASFVPNDAVSEAARRFRDLLEPDATQPRVIAEGISRPLAREAIDFRRMGPGSSADVIVYHVSTDSKIAEWLIKRRERLVVYYHNLTPAEFIEPFDPVAAERMRRARQQVAMLAERAWRSAAASTYSATELMKWGYRQPHVIPYPVTWNIKANERCKRRLVESSNGCDVLFVGRLTPNKCQHDLLRVFAELRGDLPGARLFLVGGTHLQLYEFYLRRYAQLLRIDSKVFVGAVTSPVLAAYYGAADIFCCLSQHEGFGVPLIEAMSTGTPVVALDAAAVGETIGDGGILIPSSEPRLVAEILKRISGDPALRLELIEAGTERARHFSDTASLRRAILELTAA